MKGEKKIIGNTRLEGDWETGKRCAGQHRSNTLLQVRVSGEALRPT